MDVVYIDIRNALEAISKNILLLNLENLVIFGPLLDWLRDFLVCHRQRVRINFRGSSSKPVLNGVL